MDNYFLDFFVQSLFINCFEVLQMLKTDKEYSLQILMVLETWTGVSSHS